jgi:hypothetical protein
MFALAAANPHEEFDNPLPTRTLERHFFGLRSTGATAPVLLARSAVLRTEQLDAGTFAMLQFDSIVAPSARAFRSVSDLAML